MTGPSSPLSRKSRIAVYLSSTPWTGDLDEGSVNEGLGGRETALVHLCVEWAKLGHEVYAFVPRSGVKVSDEYRLTWIPAPRVLSVAPVLDLDLFVSWEDVEVLQRLGDTNVGRRVIEMQVSRIHSPVPLSSVCDAVACLSEWAGDYLLRYHPDANVVVLPNGVDLSRFDGDDNGIDFKDDDFHLAYSSSPDRGLHHLLEMWPDVQRAIYEYYDRGSQLHVCYGVENFVGNSRWSHRSDGIRALTIERLIGQDDVVYHGRVGQDELAGILIAADLMVYPYDPLSPTETGCISVVEAMAAGTPVVTTDGDCLGPEFSDVTVQVPLPLDREQFVMAIVDALDPEDYHARAVVGLEFVKDRSWSVIAQRWIEEFCPE